MYKNGGGVPGNRTRFPPTEPEVPPTELEGPPRKILIKEKNHFKFNPHRPHYLCFQTDVSCMILILNYFFKFDIVIKLGG